MKHGLYLLSLVVSLIGLGYLDHHYRLAWFKRPRRTAYTLLTGLLLFLVWDMAGIHKGIFYTGQTTYLTGLRLAVNIPLEEAFFLLLLMYSTLITYQWMRQR